MRPLARLVPERRPPRRPDEMSLVDVRRALARLARACLLLVHRPRRDLLGPALRAALLLLALLDVLVLTGTLRALLHSTRGHLAPPSKIGLERRGLPQPWEAKRDGGARWVECPTLDHRLEQIVLETDRWRIEGHLTLPREGYRSRLSDFVNQRDREFFSIQDATLTALDAPNEVQQVAFLDGRSQAHQVDRTDYCSGVIPVRSSPASPAAVCSWRLRPDAVANCQPAQPANCQLPTTQASHTPPTTPRRPKTSTQSHTSTHHSPKTAPHWLSRVRARNGLSADGRGGERPAPGSFA